MNINNMTYTVENFEYKNFTIEISQDEFPLNPFEGWDCEPPIAVYSDQSLTEYGNDDILNPPELTRDQIKSNGVQICELTGCRSLLALVCEYSSCCLSEYTTATEAINDAIQAYIDQLSDHEKIEELPGFYALAGIVALSDTVTGYSQGCYAEVLTVATPSFIKRTGATIEKPEDLQSAIDLYGYWAFGDVWRYSITDNTGDIIDSCAGYYGKYETDESLSYGGAIAEAKRAANYYYKKMRVNRLKKLKGLIKSGASLHCRQGVLESIENGF